MLIRKASQKDLNEICVIIEQAKLFLKQQGIDQWQNGYPNPEVVADDINSGIAYVADNGSVCGYCVIVMGDDPNYKVILEGDWKNSEPYVAVHRVCVSNQVRGQGTAGALFQKAQDICVEHDIHNLKIDTHPQNLAMQRAIQKAGFTYCGKIHLLSPAENGAERWAYQKCF